MKICLDCNSTLPDSVARCTRCGGRTFRNAILEMTDHDRVDQGDRKKSRNAKFFSVIGVLALIIVVLILALPVIIPLVAG